jgi:hypothetical protein
MTTVQYPPERKTHPGASVPKAHGTTVRDTTEGPELAGGERRLRKHQKVPCGGSLAAGAR